jgi:gluconokinase
MFIVVMGVSGSGKTTIGRSLAQRLDWPFYDGDDFHSPQNVAKMSAGLPLTDGDRAGWLDALAAVIRDGIQAGRNGVIACSVLKKAYRDVLRESDREQVRFVYLKGSYEVILARTEPPGIS